MCALCGLPCDLIKKPHMLGKMVSSHQCQSRIQQSSQLPSFTFGMAEEGEASCPLIAKMLKAGTGDIYLDNIRGGILSLSLSFFI